MWPRKRKLNRDEAMAAARVAKLHPRPPRIRRSTRDLLGPRFGRQLFVAGAWLGGWSLIAWGAAEAVGPWGWKLAVGLAALAAGGLKPLGLVLLGGLAEFPPRDWFTGGDE